MQRIIIASVFLFGTALAAQASTLVFNDSHNPSRSDYVLQSDGAACDREAGVQRGVPTARYRACMRRHGWIYGHVAKSPRPRAASGVVTHDRDSRDPDVGWHWENGMRVCRHDCENPEIPGSGYTCRNVTAFGMAMRECSRQN